jgi:hypothetical protein
LNAPPEVRTSLTRETPAFFDANPELKEAYRKPVKISAANRTAPLSSAPEIEQNNNKKRGQNYPRDYNDLHPQLANRGNVVVHIRILIKKSVAIAKDVRASHQIDQEEEYRGESESGKSYGIESQSASWGQKADSAQPRKNSGSALKKLRQENSSLSTVEKREQRNVNFVCVRAAAVGSVFALSHCVEYNRLSSDSLDPLNKRVLCHLKNLRTLKPSTTSGGKPSRNRSESSALKSSRKFAKKFLMNPIDHGGKRPFQWSPKIPVPRFTTHPQARA